MFEIQHQQFRSAKRWFSRRGQIDMSPIYQRKGGLWKPEDRQSLIDTMINGYDMPKLYLADFTTIKSDLNDAGLRYAVIDGKQRLETIFSFLDNKIALSESFEYEDDNSIKLSGLYYKDIREKANFLAERVEEFPLPIVHVVSDDSVRIRELFLRLNKGLLLTGPEKRNAMSGSVPAAINELADHEFFKSSVSYTSERGQSHNNAAKILAFEIIGEPTDTKKNALDRIVTEYAQNTGTVEFCKIKSYQVLDKMSYVFGHKDKLLKSAGSIPAFYWFVRDIEDRYLKMARPFLEEFYDEMAKEKLHATIQGNAKFFEYERALRSINDKWSHQMRFDILSKSFRSWIVHYA